MLQKYERSDKWTGFATVAATISVASKTSVFVLSNERHQTAQNRKVSTLVGLGPTISGSVDRCLIHFGHRIRRLFDFRVHIYQEELNRWPTGPACNYLFLLLQIEINSWKSYYVFHNSRQEVWKLYKTWDQILVILMIWKLKWFHE